MDRAIVIDRLISPRAIAIIGASADISKINGRPMKDLIGKGYAGHLKHKRTLRLSHYRRAALAQLRFSSTTFAAGALTISEHVNQQLCSGLHPVDPAEFWAEKSDAAVFI